MCIIAAKAAGVKMPGLDTLETMFYRNPNGAGLMWAENGKVFIEKGFMTFQAFQEALYTIGQGRDLTALPVVMHFRITTHGGTSPENCHPFPVSDSNGMLRKLSLKTDMGVAHNGIIDICCEKGMSDTMTYIKRQLAPLKKGVPDFYRNKHLLRMIENAIESRMAILDSEGGITLIGDFVEDNGVMYSNTSYKPFRLEEKYPFSTSYASCLNPDLWESYEGYGVYGHTLVMWLDDYAWAEDAEGHVYYDAAVGKDGQVYIYSDEDGCLLPLEGGIAYNEDGVPLTFDPKGFVIDELVLRPY